MPRRKRGQPEGECVSHKELYKLQTLMDQWGRGGQDHTLIWTASMCISLPSIYMLTSLQDPRGGLGDGDIADSFVPLPNVAGLIKYLFLPFLINLVP